MIHIDDSLPEPNQTVAFVERKGEGHPDTLCDRAAERASRELSRLYLNETGHIQHHNLDKALLIAGNARPAYNGGKIVSPMELIIAGRATDRVNGRQLPVEETIRDAATQAIQNAVRHLVPEEHCRISVKTEPGATELQSLTQNQVPLANDTSMGVGYYPLSDTEQLVKEVSDYLNNPKTYKQFPCLGEDVKVMGTKSGNHYHLTIGAAFIGRYLADGNEYKEAKAKLAGQLRQQFSAYQNLSVAINAADQDKTGDVYLTVNGTSAELGDDGEVGRGNRCNGLITPYRPMSLEAVAGKNPLNHVGKHYNLMARDMAKTIVEEKMAEQAQVFMVSKIGAPLTEPAMVDVRLSNSSVEEAKIKDMVNEKLKGMGSLWKEVLDGRVQVGY